MNHFSAYELIVKKQNKEVHSEEEINWIINNYMKDAVPEYQIAAWLMAIYFQGMDFDETSLLTKAIINSGQRVNQGQFSNISADKHSTGGVGDKITLILAPLLASVGIKVPTITGRGLGFTGGTLDKLESIPGFNTALSLEEIISITEETGVAFGAQTNDIVPADRRLYALRDVTATVRSLPLITSSILSKKVAEGIDYIVFDVKCGDGAFMETEEEAIELSQWLVKTAAPFGLKATALVTDMNTPLGKTVGNWLETEECIKALKNETIEDDILDLTLSLGSIILKMAGKSEDYKSARNLLESKLKDKTAYQIFKATTAKQNGDISVFDIEATPHKPGYVLELKSEQSGYISKMKAREFGYAAVTLGAGREKKDDIIDMAAGFVFNKKPGDKINIGETILEIHAKDKTICEKVVKRIYDSIIIEKDKPDIKPLIKKIVTIDGIEDWNE